MAKNSKGILWFPVAVASALSVAAHCSLSAAAAEAAAHPQVLRNAVVNEPVQFDVSEPLTEMAQAPIQAGVGVAVHPMLQPKFQVQRMM